MALSISPPWDKNNLLNKLFTEFAVKTSGANSINPGTDPSILKGWFHSVKVPLKDNLQTMGYARPTSGSEPTGYLPNIPNQTKAKTNSIANHIPFVRLINHFEPQPYLPYAEDADALMPVSYRNQQTSRNGIFQQGGLPQTNEIQPSLNHIQGDYLDPRLRLIINTYTGMR